MTTRFDRNLQRLLLAVTFDPREVGERLKRARDAKGWSQMEFANRSALSISTISRRERGELPSLRHLTHHAELLDVSLADLVEDEDQRATLTARVESVEGQLAEFRGEFAAFVQEWRGTRTADPPAATEAH